MGSIGSQGQVAASVGLVPTQCQNAGVAGKKAGNQQRRNDLYATLLHIRHRF